VKKKYSASFKEKIALEAIKESKTIAELSSKHQIHRVQISQWKKCAQEAIPRVFMDGRTEKNRNKEKEDLIDELYKQIGQLKVENDWQKKI
jgi:transposase